MGSLTNWLRISFHLGRLGLSMLTVYPVFRWKVRRAKASFKDALLAEGLSLDVANTLATSYDQSNWKMLSLVDSGFSSITRSITARDALVRKEVWPE